jgi:replication factor C small subunit
LEAALWTEKYRPTTLEEIKNQFEIVNRLKNFVKNSSMPHCLFAGPPGTGKTTAALCLAKDLFKERTMDLYLELNASDARGIDVIRTTVKDFARIATITSAPFKILTLDEADNMTADAQQALRRTMERYTNTCRFILCCNYSGRIIEPIQSRCAIFRFTPLKVEDISEYLISIGEKEGIEITKEGINAIIEVSEGDMRKAINMTQSSASLDRKIDDKIVYQVIGRAKLGDVSKLLNLAIDGEFTKARDVLRNMLLRDGLSGTDILKQIHSEIFKLDIEESKKVTLADTAGEVEFRLVQGGGEEIQLSALLAKIALISKK